MFAMKYRFIIIFIFVAYDVTLKTIMNAYIIGKYLCYQLSCDNIKNLQILKSIVRKELKFS